MQRSVIFILLAIFFCGYSIGQSIHQTGLSPDWSTLTFEQKLEVALKITDTLKTEIKRKQVIDNFTNSLESKILLAESFRHFGEQAQEKNNLSEAENLYSQALRTKRDLGEQEEIGRALFRVGYVQLLQSKNEEAIEYFFESEAIFKENRSYARFSTVYITMGEAYYKMGDYDEGLKRLKEGLELSKTHDYVYGQATALLNMSELYIKMGLYDQAISKAKESILIFEKLNHDENDSINNESIAIANMNIGSAYFYKNEDQEALNYYKRALGYEGVSKSTKAKILNNLSTISLQEGKYENALNIYLNIIEENAHIKNEELLATAHMNIGNLYYQQDEYSKAKKHLAIAENMAIGNNDLDLKCEAMQLMAYNYHFLGQSDKALDYTTSWRKAEKERMKEATEAKNYEVALAFNGKLIAEQKQQYYLVLILFTILAGGIGIFIAVFSAYRQKNKRKMMEQEKQQKIETILRESENKTIRARLNGIDEERARISKDLHDSVGMMLTSTKLHFEALGDRLSNIEANNRKRFNRAFELLDQAQQETRRVVHNMADLTLTQYGLVAQVQELANSIEDAGIINVNLSTNGIDSNKRWNPSLETSIYKIIQELASNALKYAEASNLDIQIQQIEDKLSLNVVDDGKGFDPNTSRVGMGMSTLKDRVKDIGGRLNINSAIGKGTTVSIESINLN